MNVAYDLRFAVDHFAGIGTHALSLLEALLDQPGDERYTVMWNPTLPARRFDVSEIARHPRVTWVERPWEPLNPADPLRVSAWLRRLDADLFLSPFYLHPPASGCPVVLTLHDVFPLALPHTISRTGGLLFSTAMLLAQRAQLVLTGSEFSRRELIQRGGLSVDRVRAITLGVPRRVPLNLVRPTGVPDGAFAMVVGENRPRKNLRVLARAWDLLDVDETIALVSVGRDHARYASLGELAAGRTTTRVVQSLGWASEAQLAWLYAHASLVLFPSYYEGFGFPLVEAFASDVPVLAADIPVFREVGGAGASYAPPDDPYAWARAIMRLRHDAVARRVLLTAGRRRAAELTYDRTAAATVVSLRQTAEEFKPRVSRPLPEARAALPSCTPARVSSAQRSVCVLGMHRSGTSVVASLVERLGVHLGDPGDFLDPLPENPRGYWEHRAFKDLNELLLARLGGCWHTPPPLAEGWQHAAALDDLRAQARALVHERFAAHPLWGWKDPRACLTLPFWKPLLPETRYVICLRNPWEVSRSLRARDDLPLRDGLRLWLTYTAAALAHSTDRPRLVLFYDDVLQDPAGAAADLARFTSCPPLSRDAAASLVSPGLRHHRSSPVSNITDRECPYPVSSLYLILRSLSSPSAGARAHEMQLDATFNAAAASALAMQAALDAIGGETRRLVTTTPLANAKPSMPSAMVGELRGHARAYLAKHQALAIAYRQARRSVRRSLRLGP